MWSYIIAVVILVELKLDTECGLCFVGPSGISFGAITLAIWKTLHISAIKFLYGVEILFA